MDSEQARALGDPTRHALFEAVLAAPEPVPVAVLADHVGMHPNAVRPQLARLVAAGLLEELVDPVRRRGRPRHLYRPAPGAAASGSAGTEPYERLSRLLLEVLTDGRPPAEVGEAHGRALARQAGDPDPLAALEHELALEGFGPRRVAGDEPDTAVLELGHCPFAGAVRVAPEIVCAVHLGLCRGFAAERGGLDVRGLEVRDPAEGACRVVVRRAGGRPPEAGDGGEAGGGAGEGAGVSAR